VGALEKGYKRGRGRYEREEKNKVKYWK